MILVLESPSKVSTWAGAVAATKIVDADVHSSVAPHGKECETRVNARTATVSATASIADARRESAVPREKKRAQRLLRVVRGIGTRTGPFGHLPSPTCLVVLRVRVATNLRSPACKVTITGRSGQQKSAPADGDKFMVEGVTVAWRAVKATEGGGETSTRATRGGASCMQHFPYGGGGNCLRPRVLLVRRAPPSHPRLH